VRPRGDRLDGPLRVVALAAAASALVLVGLLFTSLVYGSRLSLARFGAGFLVSAAWDPVAGRFGALSSVYGTLVSTLLAMLFAVPPAFLVGFFLAEICPPALARPVGQAVELLASIPSIIYGMWGLFVVAPFLAEHVQPLLGRSLGFLPLFQGPPLGIGMLTAGWILSIMILPFMTSVVREVFAMTPRELREAAFGLGATRWEVAWKVTRRYGAKALTGGLLLGLGRALGETMAVTFVIGNDHTISASLFTPANTISSTLANEFSEASDALYLSALTELGLILLVMTFAINGVTQWWLSRVRDGR
jgi:phosphate transport system permease protein